MIEGMNEWEVADYKEYCEAVHDTLAMENAPESYKVVGPDGTVVLNRWGGHKDVYIKRLPGVEIDERLASVMDLLVEQGIKTTNSCQGGPPSDDNEGGIVFATTNDLARGTRLLAGVAFAQSYMSLGTRILGRDFACLPGLARAINEDTVRKSWKYVLWRDWFHSGSEVDIMVAEVIFPTEDLVLLDELIRTAWKYPDTCKNTYYKTD